MFTFSLHIRLYVQSTIMVAMPTSMCGNFWLWTIGHTHLHVRIKIDSKSFTIIIIIKIPIDEDLYKIEFKGGSKNLT